MGSAIATWVRALSLFRLLRLDLGLADPWVGGRSKTDRFDPPDISDDLCWVGGWTKERCCQGDATTQSECWADSFSFAECCPNADCWDDGGYTYDQCCDKEKYGEGGNSACWSGVYSYEHCCLASKPAQNWVDVLTSGVDTEQFYSMDEFYTDAQYGDDFGYYSTGRVLKSLQSEAGTEGAQQFAHFTTYPMALSPHFGRVICRLLFLMWIHLEERAPFRVVEMGAGSGQLAYDIQQCVRLNELGIAPAVWRRWVASFEYLIMERSPALAQRQRQRGLRVVPGDAQSGRSCAPILAALAASVACGGGGAASEEAPECRSGERATEDTGTSVVLSNELLDAFSPVKLRLSVFGQPNVTDCGVWQEMRLVHVISEKDLRLVTKGLQHSDSRVEALLDDLRGYTSEMFCGIKNTTVGRAAADCSPDRSCLAIAFGLSELLAHADLQLPAASHNMRLRLRKDSALCARLREVTDRLESELQEVVVLPRQVYQQLRHQLREAPNVEVLFLARVSTRQVPAPLSQERCNDLSWWLATHQDRIHRLLDLYRPLGYPAIQLLVRPGERNFVELADCLVGPNSGFMLSIDYGASFEALGHSLSVDPLSDGIFIPPVPQELLQDLPDCYTYWPICAGRVDWTTFVDFTNVAAAGEQLGWRTLTYGPQSILEQISRRNVSVGDHAYSVPGYGVLAKSWASRHVQNWYGRETLASSAETSGWEQRWTSFKALLMEKPKSPSKPKPSILASPSWHLDALAADRCWSLDATSLPLADWIQRQPAKDPREAMGLLTETISDRLGREYSDAYEEAQLAVRMVDWLVAAEGCQNFRPPAAASLLASNSLWLPLRRRLLRAWEPVWGAEAVERIALAVLRRLADLGDAEQPRSSSPAECSGQQAYIELCVSPGDGVRSKERLYMPE